MHKNLILKSDILDIIFYKRNKAYGAYNLRKFYPHRLKLALGFMLIIALAFTAFTLLPQKVNRVSSLMYTVPETIFTKIEIKPNEPVQKPKTVKPVAAVTAAMHQKMFKNNIVVVADNVKADTVNTLLPTDIIGRENMVTEKPGGVIILPVKPETGSGVAEKIIPIMDLATPMDLQAADVPPAFPGGMDAFMKFMERNLHTPADLENGETVNVRIRFVVGYTGKLQSFETIADGGEVYNKEVIRVLKKMPDWLPGKAKGENVSVYYTIPVKFAGSD